MVICGYLYVFTIRKISISWSVSLRHQVVCWICLWRGLLMSWVFVLFPYIVMFPVFTRWRIYGLIVLPLWVFSFLIQRPQGKSYLFFTQFKAEIKGAKIEYASAYVSITYPVNTTEDSPFPPMSHEKTM